VKQQPGLKTVKRRQLVDEVISQLQDQISLGRYTVGSKIPTEPELMQLLGVSRTTVREAVRVLASLGLLEVRQGDGTYVISRSSDMDSLERRLRQANIRDVYEVRRMLEIEIVRLAVQRRTTEDLAAMRASLADKASAWQGEKVDVAAYVAADMNFHNAIASASKNSVLADLYFTFSAAIRNALTYLIQDKSAPDYAATWNSHQQLLQAIEAGDAAEAEKWTRAHLDQVLSQLQ